MAVRLLDYNSVPVPNGAGERTINQLATLPSIGMRAMAAMGLQAFLGASCFRIQVANDLALVAAGVGSIMDLLPYKSTLTSVNNGQAAL